MAEDEKRRPPAAAQASASSGEEAVGEGAVAAAGLRAGDRIRDRYQIRRQLGASLRGQTWLAHDELSDRDVVVKILPLAEIADTEAHERFERQAGILRGIESKAIPKLVDSFTTDLATGPSLCLVREFVAGSTLTEIVASGRRFEPSEVARIGRQVADILIDLHGRSPAIVVRDIHPSNLILDHDGDVHLVDFGSALVGGDPDLLEVASTSLGSYGYAPPEQYAGKASAASDLYALGATLVFLLSHRDPAAMEGADGRLDFAPHVRVSAGLARLLSRATDPDPAKRPASAREMRAALHRLQILSPRSGDDAGRAQVSGGKRSGLRWLLGGAAAAIGLVGVLLLGALGAVTWVLARIFGHGR